MDYCIDPGNALTKALESGNQRRVIVPSCIKSLAPHERRIKGNDKSPVIIYQDGGTELACVIGKLADERLGIWNYATKRKIDRLKPLLFATLPQQHHSDITRLLVAVPDEIEEGTQAELDRLVGAHHFSRNGVKMSCTIRKVIAVSETYCAYLGAIHHRLFAFPDRHNAIVTVGGGTLNLAIVDSSGNSIDEYSAVAPLGLLSLANRISAALPTHPRPSSIMTALGEGSNMASHTDFSSVFEACRLSWVADIRGALIEKLGSQLSEIGDIIITGAPSPLLADYVASVGGRMKIAPNAGVFGLEGMQYYR